MQVHVQIWLKLANIVLTSHIWSKNTVCQASRNNCDSITKQIFLLIVVLLSHTCSEHFHHIFVCIEILEFGFNIQTKLKFQILKFWVDILRFIMILTILHKLHLRNNPNMVKIIRETINNVTHHSEQLQCC